MNPSNGITFREDFGEWWPDYDHKPEACIARVRKGLADMDVAAGLCRERRVCIQAGAHAGLWPRRLAGIFDRVICFEPDEPLFECARRNLASVGNVEIVRAALGASNGIARLERRSSAGSSRIDAEKGEFVGLMAIDSYYLRTCDAIYLDVEGYEVEALKGAVVTIATCSPVLHLEELERSGPAIREYVASIGYKLHRRIHSDAVYVRK